MHSNPAPILGRLKHLAIGLAMFALAAAADPEDLPARARSAALKGAVYWAETVASHGGYVWEYSTDLTTRRRGEGGEQPLSTNWVQAGTPMVGEAFLHLYTATGDSRLLKGALAAGHCLEYGQLQSGGWAYSIEHDPARVKDWYHHLGEAGKDKRNTTTFDDDNTQSATRFLMELDRHVDDPRIDGAIARALDCFLKAQYREGPWDGSWPQRYPPPESGYGAYPTFNDGTMGDCLRTMVKTHSLYGVDAYLEAVKRCIEFYLRSQLPEPQAAWAQQYDRDLKPAWARRFEPPSVTGGESRGNCMTLMDMYIAFGDQRCLDAVGRCVDWYRRSRLDGTEESGVWARFYEVGSNRPLYFTRTYELVYEDNDLPVHYAFKGGFGVDSMMRRYETVRKTSREALIAERDGVRSPEQWAALAERLKPDVERILAAQDDLGRWVRVVPRREQVRDAEGRIGYTEDKDKPLAMMYSNATVRNLRTLADYIMACQGGPAVKAPDRLPPKG